MTSAPQVWHHGGGAGVSGSPSQNGINANSSQLLSTSGGLSIDISNDHSSGGEGGNNNPNNCNVQSAVVSESTQKTIQAIINNTRWKLLSYREPSQKTLHSMKLKQVFQGQWKAVCSAVEHAPGLDLPDDTSQLTEDDIMSTGYLPGTTN
jgi:hypothetical protein